MLLGPIVHRELTTATRRPRYYGERTVVPLVLLLVVGANYYGWRYYNGGPSTVQDAANFGRYTFAQFAWVQVLATLALVPEAVARTIAEERDRRTLGDLLTTELSAAAIVLGKLLAGLGRYFGCLAAGLPVLLLLPLFGGVEPEWVLMAYAGTASTALLLAGVSLANSVAARQGRDAKRITLALAGAWLIVPMIVALALPILTPRIYPWIRPLNELALASSPTGVMLSTVGLLPRGSLPEVLGRMIGLQLAGAVLTTLVAVVSLRPVYRRLEGGPSRRFSKARLRPRNRPACGDRPMLWKERYVGGTRGFLRLLGTLATLSILGSIAVATYYAGRNAFADVLASGYSSGDASLARAAFNGYLRALTLLIGFLYGLTVTGLSAEGISVEWARETWLGLIATPLEGSEIVRAKMFGAVWRSRVFGLLLLSLWTAGLIAGAVHPLGFATALIALVASTWFCVALGAFGALRAGTLAGASNAALLPVLLLSLSGFLPRLLPESLQTVVLGAGSAPLVECLGLLSYRDVATAFSPTASSTLDALGLSDGERPSHALLAYLIGVGGFASAGWFFDRLARRHFDRLVGRPWRPSVKHDRAEPTSAQPAPAASQIDTSHEQPAAVSPA